MFLRHGTFNAGVLAVGPGSREFVDWWAARKARHCLDDAGHGLTLDQGWLSLVPALFAHVVVDDPGINVMGWNIHDRDVSWHGDTPMVPGGPLRCFHFAGTFDPRAPERFGPGPGGRRPGVAALCRDYADRLLAAGYEAAIARPYAYTELPGGPTVDALMRDVYRAALLAHESGSGPEPPNPFGDGDAEPFLSWLASPETGKVPRYLRAVRAARADLVEAFPDVPGDDERFLRWAAEAAQRGEIELPWER